MLLKTKIIIGVIVALAVVGVSVTLALVLDGDVSCENSKTKLCSSALKIPRRLHYSSLTNYAQYINSTHFNSKTKKKCADGTTSKTEERSFKIDYENGQFLMDGEEFRYVAGSFHYFRAHQDSWQTKLRTMRAAGLNAVDVYINWALHHPKGDGNYVFEGIADIVRFIELATEEDLYIILRPGPYICAEIDNGGLPYWLRTKYPDIQLRTNDFNYKKEVREWYAILMEKMKVFMYGNGGNIIMVQVENEYGVYGACDKDYLRFLRDETLKYTEDKAVLFTTDIPNSYEEAMCGTIDDVYPTVDFGIDKGSQMDEIFALQRQLLPAGKGKGPLVNSEFYPGWLTHWQESNQRRDASVVADTLKSMLEAGASVNFYMFFGGTNFGFSAGANDWGIGTYQADITSYDYDAPMDEAGDPTEKYTKIRAVIEAFFGQTLQSPPAIAPKISLPSITMEPLALLLSDKSRSYLGSSPVTASKPKTFEELDQFSGFVLYETVLPEFKRDPALLTVNGLRDRAIVLVDDLVVGVLSRENTIDSLPLSSSTGSTLKILVENQGRINFNKTDDVKGIIGSVTLQTYGDDVELSDWSMTGFELENVDNLNNLIYDVGTDRFTINKNGVLNEGPVVFNAKFDITAAEISDTYLDPTGWGKGIVYINGFHLGRYWPLVGPQVTMYVPKEILLKTGNNIIVLEYQRTPSNKVIKFTNVASIDK